MVKPASILTRAACGLLGQLVLLDAGLGVLFVDDYGQTDSYPAHIVLNQNVYASENFYRTRSSQTSY